MEAITGHCTSVLVQQFLRLPTFYPQKGAEQPPTFRPMSIVTKRSLISGIAELLFCFRLDYFVLMFYFLARQASAGRLILCRCYFLSYSFFLFLNDCLEQRDLGNYMTDVMFRVIDMLV